MPCCPNEQHRNNKEAGRNLNAVYVTSNAAPRMLYSEELVAGDYRKKVINALFRYPTVFCRAGQDEFDCALIDEAHRVFDFKPGVGASTHAKGWT